MYVCVAHHGDVLEKVGAQHSFGHTSCHCLRAVLLSFRFGLPKPMTQEGLNCSEWTRDESVHVMFKIEKLCSTGVMSFRPKLLVYSARFTTGMFSK